MKIDRLLGIITVLINHDKTTLSDLAHRFEVSKRTISRDIEAICQAGIPIVAVSGYQGGISIMEGYKLDQTVLTTTQLRFVLAGLKGLDSIGDGEEYRNLEMRLGMALESSGEDTPPLQIDLTSSRKTALLPKISSIQEAIIKHQLLSFHYCSQSGEGTRSIEPYELIFHWSSWYVWGYCRKRQDFRLFKLNRMDQLNIDSMCFNPKSSSQFSVDMTTLFQKSIEIVALAESRVKWRIIDELGTESFEEQENGKLLIRSSFTDRKTLFGWILSYGSDIKLIAPEELCRELLALLQDLVGFYKH